MSSKVKVTKADKAEVKAKIAENQEVDLGLKKTFNEADPEAPIVKAIAIQKIGAHWSTVEYTIQGDKVLTVEADEPNLRPIAIDCFKIRAQRNFME